MTRRWIAVLAALTAGSCAIPVDPQRAQTIPSDLSVAKLQEMLPKASYVSCMDPRVTIDQSDIKGWTVDRNGLEFRSSRKDPFRLSWSACRAVELAKVLFRYEVRVFVAIPGNPRKELYHFNWRDEAEARRAAELFESLRGDR